MTRSRDRRLGRVRYALDAAPLQRSMIREAYEWFRAFGELPDDPRLAEEVVREAMKDGSEDDDFAGVPYYMKPRPNDRWPPSVRAMLFEEALYAAPQLRDLARLAIAREVAHGGDIENPGFAARHGMPCYGSVAMHIFGWQRRLTVPPYEDQATRLFVRLDGVRGKIPHDDPRWAEEQAQAELQFRQTGELPEDDLHLEVMLVNVEIDLLRKHQRGEDVAAALALLDRLAQAGEDQRDRLLDEVKTVVPATLATPDTPNPLCTDSCRPPPRPVDDDRTLD